MSEVVVVATFRVKAGHEEATQRILHDVIAATHAEPGCLLYALHRSLDDPAVFVIVERWASRAALDEHFTRPHMEGLREAFALLAEPPVVHFTEPLGDGAGTKWRIGAPADPG